MECPVVKAIREIRGAGIYKDEFDDANLIKIGGNEATEYICDSVKFFIMMRKMEFARYELTNAPLYNFVKKLPVCRNYWDMYIYIVNTELDNKYIYKQFVNLIDLIHSIEKYIIAKVERLQHSSINLSLPKLVFEPDIDEVILYRPDILGAEINKLIKYMGKMNINSIIDEHIDQNIELVKIFDKKIDFNQLMPDPQKMNVRKYAQEYMKHEEIVANHVMDVEQYHCYIINHVNDMYKICNKIVECLLR